MHPSLLSQFQGVLVGAALGGCLGFHGQRRTQAKMPLSWLDVDQWGWTALPPPGDRLPIPAVSWEPIVINGIEQLIQHHRWDLNGLPTALTTTTDVLTMAIATLPLALYFHDDPIQLRQQTHTLLNHCCGSEMAHLTEVVLIPGRAIALLLEQHTRPQHLIPALITALQLEQNTPLAAQRLADLQSQLDQGTPLAQILPSQRHLRSAPSGPLHCLLNLSIVALYSVLSTPGQFRLSLLQAAHLTDYPPLSCALVGALSGAYNGLSGLPLSWCRSLDASREDPHPALSPWNMTSVAELLDRADALFASWTGIFDPRTEPDLALPPVIAAPGGFTSARLHY